MFVLKSQDQGLITLSQQDYLPILVDSFLIDRRSQGLSPETIELYTKKLQYCLKYCERQVLTQVSQITPNFIRRYLLELSETHNLGGVHADICLHPMFHIIPLHAAMIGGTGFKVFMHDQCIRQIKIQWQFTYERQDIWICFPYLTFLPLGADMGTAIYRVKAGKIALSSDGATIISLEDKNIAL